MTGGTSFDGPPRGRAGRWATAAEALDAIADGSCVYVAGGTAAPLALDRAMADQRDRWRTLDLLSDRFVTPLAMFEDPQGPFRLISLQPSPAVDALRDRGALVDAAVPYSQFPAQMAAYGPWPIDAAIVHVSPPGPEGKVSLGVSVATPLAAMGAAPLVIAQANPAMPYTFGAGELSLDRFDLLVEAEHPLVEMPRTPQDPSGNDPISTIGRLTAALIPDGATLQIGIGAVADAVLVALADHKDLAVHSGMISDGIVDLHASGAFTGAHHPRFPGKIIAALVGGTKVAFDFVDRNPDVLMVPTSISHGQDSLRTLPRFTAVNSGVEVDLSGAVNGEMIGKRVISGPGGAPDYAAAAAKSDDARFIVALPATAAGGTRSRIVSKLDSQVTTTVPGHHVSHVVTEYGAADLVGLSSQEQAAAIRSVASPDLRHELLGSGGIIDPG